MFGRGLKSTFKKSSIRTTAILLSTPSPTRNV